MVRLRRSEWRSRRLCLMVKYPLSRRTAIMNRQKLVQHIFVVLALGCLVALPVSSQAGPLYSNRPLAYNEGYPNMWSGLGAVGTLFDVQVADDFTLSSPSMITGVTADYLTFQGLVPAEGVTVSFYADLSGMPANTASLSVLATPAQVTLAPFTDVVFPSVGFFGVTLDVHGLHIQLDAGTWWVNIQPHDTTADGDWYAQTIATSVSGNVHVRDGGHAAGFYGVSWIGPED